MTDQLLPCTVEEIPCVDSGQLLRLEIRNPNFNERHFLEISEKTHEVHKDYHIIGEVQLLHLSHFFDTIYGVSSLAGMDAQTAIKMGEKMVEWGQANL